VPVLTLLYYYGSMRMQRCNIYALQHQCQGPGTDFARPHDTIFLLGNECTWRMEVLHRTLHHTARTIMQEHVGLHFNRPETGHGVARALRLEM
jgi:hypothetical protein